MKGWAQTQEIDYEETYSLVVRYNSLRYIFALAAIYKLAIHHMDVTTAYLQGELPQELIDQGEGEKIWKLKRLCMD